ncbi:MAG: XrtA system polysaccharide deacetylase [Acidobacteriota bacterium]
MIHSSPSHEAAVTHALSVDLEDWFHASNMARAVPRHRWETVPSRLEIGTQRLLTLFAKHQVRATFFALGWIAERFPELIARIVDAGHHVESHGYDHRLVFTLTPDELRRDVRRSLDAIERATGRRPTGFRAASFSIDPRCPWAFDVLAEEGIAYDSSVFPVYHPRYGWPRFSRHPCWAPVTNGRRIKEFPLTTLAVPGCNLGVAGGAYLRLLPLALLQYAFRRSAARGRPGILYVHPWELDPDPPRVRIGHWGGWTHYANLSSSERKLDTLLGAFAWAPVAEVLDAYGPELLPAGLEVAHADGLT